jgi:hypothetical protein
MGDLSWGWGGGKGTEFEADHSPKITVEVNKTWIYTSPPYVFMA